jgi:hypothetical protein
MGSIDDISELCRLCLVKDQVNIPIFDETSDIRQTFLKINSCLPVKVSWRRSAIFLFVGFLIFDSPFLTSYYCLSDEP